MSSKITSKDLVNHSKCFYFLSKIINLTRYGNWFVKIVTLLLFLFCSHYYILYWKQHTTDIVCFSFSLVSVCFLNQLSFFSWYRDQAKFLSNYWNQSYSIGKKKRFLENDTKKLYWMLINISHYFSWSYFGLVSLNCCQIVF